MAAAVDQSPTQTVTWPGAWANPWHEDPFLSEDERRGRFFDFIDFQPWFREAMRRELTGALVGVDADREIDARMLDSVMAICKHTELLHPVLVFGSNLAAIHGKGAAREAALHYGAEDRVSEGLCAQSYALPTKNHGIAALPLDAIEENISRFLAHARANPRREYLLTRVGCGLAEHDPEQIGPLFASAPENVFLPGVWEHYRGTSVTRVIVAGSRSVTSQSGVSEILDRVLGSLDRPTIVSGGARGVDHIGECYAVERGLPLERFPAWWHTQGRAAGAYRNQRMSWRATHLVAIWDGQSRGTKNMIDTARADGLGVRVIDASKLD
jgi:hypothetical protein